MQKFLEKHKETILYLLFGGLTTFISIASYVLLRLLFPVMTAQILSWAIAVLFAYSTNKIFVFNSRQESLFLLLKEFLVFIASRIITGLLEFIMIVALIKENTSKPAEIILKILVTIVVIIANYIFSKLIVFAKKNSKEKIPRHS